MFTIHNTVILYSFTDILIEIYDIMDIFGPTKGRKYPQICGRLASDITR